MARARIDANDLYADLPMLRIDKLTKRYGDYPVFDGLTQTFEPGCIALCEEDSTGKSTLLAIVAGEMAADGGDVWIDGHSMINAPQAARARLAYVPDNCLRYPAMTGRELLAQTAADKGVALDDATLALAEALGLTPHLDKRFEQMSTGSRRKVFLTAANLGRPGMGRPGVVIADGPTNGLDMAARDVLAEVFAQWGEDRVVLFASHDPEFVRACGAREIKVGTLREPAA